MKRAKSKKMTAGLLLLTLVLTLLTACGGSDSNSGKQAFIGKWTAVTVEVESETMSASDFEAALGEPLNMTIEFKSDDTAILSIVDELGEGTYTVEGNTAKITVDGDTVEFTLNSGKLVGEIEGVIFTLTK